MNVQVLVLDVGDYCTVWLDHWITLVVVRVDYIYVLNIRYLDGYSIYI